MFKALAKKAKALHRDEQGADMLEYILIVAAVALPLVAVIIWYFEDISKWAKDLWNKAKAGEGTDPDDL
jgi:Flp pilus assembly pilin Flp